jgi:S1-C subfamily serine protease
VLDERGGSTARRTYFGALYATAETGEGGVTVLDVIPGSPAARAGFEGVNAQRSTRGQLADALIVGAAPLAGPFAPLIILPYAIYRSRQAPGDLIVAVGEQQVRDAVEFSQALRNHQPGDTVTFSVLRQGKSLQIPVQLEEEPL